MPKQYDSADVEWAIEEFKIDERAGGRQLYVPKGQDPARTASGGRLGTEVKVIHRILASGQVRVGSFRLDGNICHERPHGKTITIPELRRLTEKVGGEWEHVGKVLQEQTGLSHNSFANRLNGMAKSFSVTNEQADAIREAAGTAGLYEDIVAIKSLAGPGGLGD